MLKRLLQLAALVLLLGAPAYAQNSLFMGNNSLFGTVPPVTGPYWNGVLAPSRAIDWTGNGATIINRVTQCGSTIAAYGSSGSPASASTISTALSSCAAGDYVQLGAGTFYLNTTLTSTASNVTLRGMGANQTFIVFMATTSNCNGVGRTAVCMYNGDGNSFQFPPPSGGGNIVNITGGLSQGSTVLTASGTTNLHVGSNFILTQDDDASDPGNTIWISQTSGFNGAASQQGGSGVAKAGASESQNVTVTNIAGSLVTVTPGLYMDNWVSTKHPTGWYSSTLPITGCGIENLSLDYSNLGTQENGIEFHDANSCWLKNIRSINSVSSGGATHKHVNIYASNHITVRDSYFYGASPTSEGYGVDSGPGSSNNLIENNIFQHLPTGMITETSCCNVFAYNWAVDNYYNNGAPNWQQQDQFHHGAGDYYNLFEGNEGTGFDADNIHGTSWMETHFRNFLSGWDQATSVAVKNQSTFAYFIFSNSRDYNVVNNILGTGGFHTTYMTSSANPTDCGNSAITWKSVFVFGFSDQAGTGFNPTCLGTSVTLNNDPLSKSTTMLWGNYAACTGDAACNSVRFVNSENASGISHYPGLISPATTFPASFYYATKPAWYLQPWPSVGGDVGGGTLGTGTSGHVNLNPAAYCYLNNLGGLTNGSSGALTYDITLCGGTVPSSGIVQANGAASSSVSYGGNVTAGNALYAFVFCGVSSTCTVAVTSTHEAGLWSAPIYAPLATDGDRIAVFCATAATTGTDNVSATGNSSSANISRIQVYEAVGASCTLDTTTPSGGSATSNVTASSPITSPSLTTTTNGDFIFYYVANSTATPFGTDSWTIGGGFSNMTCMAFSSYSPSCSVSGSTGIRTAVAALVQTTAGAVTPSITSTGANSKEYGTIVVAFKP